MAKRTAKDAIYDALIQILPSDDEWENVFRSVYGYLPENELVDWFVCGYFSGNEEEIREELGEEDAKIVLDHYEAHRA